MNNATLLRIDRTTHLKVVAIAVIASTVVGIVGASSRVAPSASVMQSVPVHAVSRALATG